MSASVSAGGPAPPFSGRTALITGAAGDISRAVAVQLAGVEPIGR